MEQKPLTLRERQLEYLRILKELDHYCTDNGLIYYMGCGTLIGAVRHKGFIPWDDDLDVFMPRPDFLKLCSTYNSDGFTFHSIRNDKSHSFNFGRLCSNKVYSIDRGKPLYNMGIDVYVINGAPSNKEEQVKFVKETFAFIKRKCFLERVRGFLVRKNLWPSKTLDFALLNKVLFQAERCFERYDYETSEYIWPYGGGRLIMKKTNYGTPIRLQFEDGYFCAPENYHEVLTLGYGDYMLLPPEEQRHPYHSGLYYWKN